MSEDGPQDATYDDPYALPDPGPPSPRAWLLAGIGVQLLAAAVYGLGLEGDAPVVAVLGILVLAGGSIVTLVGAVATGVSIALRSLGLDRSGA